MQVVNPLQDLNNDREMGRMKEKTSVMVGGGLILISITC